MPRTSPTRRAFSSGAMFQAPRERDSGRKSDDAFTRPLFGSLRWVCPPMSGQHGMDGFAAKIAVQDVSFYYGATHALKNVSLQLYDRNVTAFIGPSGCGKSTLLRILNRMYELYPMQRATGTVLLDGENILDGKQDLNLLRTKV